MPNKRSPAAELRQKISVRLPQWLIVKMADKGTVTEVVEKAVMEYLKEDIKDDIE